MKDLWKENFSKQLILIVVLVSILANYPKLLQRPIVIKDNKTIIIAREIEKLENFL